MYKDYFKFKEQPFAIEPDPRFIMLGQDHHEALATLIYAIEQQEGWALLLGAPGVGKTTLIISLLRELKDRVVAAVMTNPRLEPLDFYNMIALELGMEGPYASKGMFLVALGELIKSCRQEKRVLLLVVDEAQSLEADMLEELRLLGNLDDSTPRVLNIFLVGQPEILRLLKRAQSQGLMQRLKRVHLIKPLGAEETAKYIKHRLKVAGGKEDLFDPGALDAVYRITKGVPRIINSLCDDSLLAAFVQEKPRVDKQMVVLAARDNPTIAWPSNLEAQAAPEPAPAEAEPPSEAPAPEPVPESTAPAPAPSPAQPKPRPRPETPAPAMADGAPAARAKTRPPQLEDALLPELDALFPMDLDSQNGEARKPVKPKKKKIREKPAPKAPARPKEIEPIEIDGVLDPVAAQAPARAGFMSRFASKFSKKTPGSFKWRLAFILAVAALVALGYGLAQMGVYDMARRQYWLWTKGRLPEIVIPENATTTTAPQAVSPGIRDWGPKLESPAAPAAPAASSTSDALKGDRNG